MIIKTEDLQKQKFHGQSSRYYDWIIGDKKLLEIYCEYRAHNGWEVWMGKFPKRWSESGYRLNAPIHLRRLTIYTLTEALNKIVTADWIAKKVFDNIFKEK